MKPFFQSYSLKRFACFFCLLVIVLSGCASAPVSKDAIEPVTTLDSQSQPRSASIDSTPAAGTAALPAGTPTVLVGTPSATGGTVYNIGMSGSWQIAFGLSGGFVGLDRSLEVDSSGQMTVMDLRSKRQVTVTLTQAQVAQLAGLVTAAGTLKPANDLPNCNDCFIYRLDLVVAKQDLTFQLNDVSLAGSGLEALVKALKDLQQGALAGQP
jgi:hypothetical protein